MHMSLHHSPENNVQQVRFNKRNNLSVVQLNMQLLQQLQDKAMQAQRVTPYVQGKQHKPFLATPELLLMRLGDILCGCRRGTIQGDFLLPTCKLKKKKTLLNTMGRKMKG